MNFHTDKIPRSPSALLAKPALRNLPCLVWRYWYLLATDPPLGCRKNPRFGNPPFVRCPSGLMLEKRKLVGAAVRKGGHLRENQQQCERSQRAHIVIRLSGHAE